jgi:hypothetical protein
MKKLTSRIFSLIAVAATLSSTVNYGAAESGMDYSKLSELSSSQKKVFTKNTAREKVEAARLLARAEAVTNANDMNKPKEVIKRAEKELEETIEEAKTFYESTKDYLGEMSMTKKVLGGVLITAATALGLSYALQGEEGYGRWVVGGGVGLVKAGYRKIAPEKGWKDLLSRGYSHMPWVSAPTEAGTGTGTPAGNTGADSSLNNPV